MFDCSQVRLWCVFLLLGVWWRVKPSDFSLPAREMLALPACLRLYIDFPLRRLSACVLAARCSPGSFFTPSRLQLSQHAGCVRCSSRRALLPLHACAGSSETWSCREASGICAIFLLTPIKSDRIWKNPRGSSCSRHVPQFGIFC